MLAGSGIMVEVAVLAFLVGGQDLVSPGAELGDASVDSRGRGGAAAASPGDNTDQGPRVVLLTDQGSTRVTLR